MYTNWYVCLRLNELSISCGWIWPSFQLMWFTRFWFLTRMCLLWIDLFFISTVYYSYCCLYFSNCNFCIFSFVSVGVLFVLCGGTLIKSSLFQLICTVTCCSSSHLHMIHSRSFVHFKFSFFRHQLTEIFKYWIHDYKWS